MMQKHTLLLAGAGLALTAALGTIAFGQNTAGPFTTAQATAGHQAFDANCAPCHLPDLAGTNDAPGLAGPAFMGAWGKRTIAQLYSKIAATSAFTPTTATQIDTIATGRATAPASRGASVAQASGRQESAPASGQGNA